MGAVIVAKPRLGLGSALAADEGFSGVLSNASPRSASGESEGT